MTAAQRRVSELHEELASMYRQFPYVTITNTHTESVWREIERLEAQA